MISITYRTEPKTATVTLPIEDCWVESSPPPEFVLATGTRELIAASATTQPELLTNVRAPTFLTETKPSCWGIRGRRPNSRSDRLHNFAKRGIRSPSPNSSASLIVLTHSREKCRLVHRRSDRADWLDFSEFQFPDAEWPEHFFEDWVFDLPVSFKDARLRHARFSRTIFKEKVPFDARVSTGKISDPVSGLQVKPILTRSDCFDTL